LLEVTGGDSNMDLVANCYICFALFDNIVNMKICFRKSFHQEW